MRSLPHCGKPSATRLEHKRYTCIWVGMEWQQHLSTLNTFQCSHGISQRQTDDNSWKGKQSKALRQALQRASRIIKTHKCQDSWPSRNQKTTMPDKSIRKKWIQNANSYATRLQHPHILQISFTRQKNSILSSSDVANMFVEKWGFQTLKSKTNWRDRSRRSLWTKQRWKEPVNKGHVGFALFLYAT